MRRLDSYILRQLMGPFLFFVLVFTGVIWLAQSLRVIDVVVNNGQSARVFLELTVLLLPTVLGMVLPIAAFAAALYAVNRLFGDSEIVVMFAAGVSAAALMRPLAIFAGGLMAVVLALTLYLAPTAQRELKARISELRGDIAAAFLREGAFQSPVPGVTVYLRELGRPGEILGIFVHDERDPDEVVTYTAERAAILADAEGTRLVMFDGVAQLAPRHEADSISILRFQQFAYDLTRLTDKGGERRLKPSELYLPDLLTITQAEAGGRSLGAYRAEAHEALSGPIYVLTLPLLALALVVGAGFRRQGFVGRIVVAVAAAAALRLTGLGLKSAATAEAALWPTMYLPPLIGILVAVWILEGWPVPWRKRRNGSGTGNGTGPGGADGEVAA